MGDDNVKCLGPSCPNWVSKSKSNFQIDGKCFCSRRCMDEYRVQFSAYNDPAQEPSPGWAAIYMSICIAFLAWLICPHKTLLKILLLFDITPIDPGTDERLAGGFFILMMLFGVSTFFFRRKGVPLQSWKELIFWWSGLLAGIKFGIYLAMGWLGGPTF